MKRMKAIKKNDYRIEALGQLSGIPIDKAIEILHTLLRDLPEYYPDDRTGAVKLGIKALKLIAKCPPDGYSCIPRPLPGETKD